MTVEVKHPFVSAKGDGPDATRVQPSNWNAVHNLTQATGKLLGRATAGAGATEEIAVGSGLVLDGTGLSASTELSGDATPQLGGFLDPNGNYVGMDKGGDLTSASPLVIGVDGDYFDVAGTVSYAAMTVAANRFFCLQFDGVLTMTHHATNLNLPEGVDITTRAGDRGIFYSTGANTVHCLVFIRAGAQVNQKKGADVAAASNLVLGIDGNTFDITGTAAAIDTIATLGVGTIITLHASAAWTINHHATNLILPGAANIVAAIGDEFTFVEYASGDWRCIGYALASGIAIVSEASILHVRDEKAAGTNGGTFTSGAWQTRDLAEKFNDIAGASVAANQITLPAGTYRCEARAPAFEVGPHKAILYNVTDAANELIGSSADSNVGGYASTDSVVSGVFTLAAEKVLELRHQCGNTKATSGFGLDSNFAVVEVYSEVLIFKIA